METLGPKILDDLRHGRALRERKLAVCSSGAHLAVEDRVEILTVLAQDADELVASKAGEALLMDPPEVFVQALGRDTALHAFFAYCGR